MRHHREYRRHVANVLHPFPLAADYQDPASSSSSGMYLDTLSAEPDYQNLLDSLTPIRRGKAW